jgi:hypothetical protein
VNTMLLTAVGAIALTTVSAPAGAQMNMPGMRVSAPVKPTPKKKASAKQKASVEKPAAAKTATERGRTGHSRSAAKATGQAAMPGTVMPISMPMSQSPGQQGAMPMTMPMPSQQGAQSAMPPMGEMPIQRGEMSMPMGEHGEHMMNMTGAFGSYPMSRESSGTSWQPDTSEHMGLMRTSGDWTLMAHGVVNLVNDHQSGPRGNDKAFASGMLMGMARRPLGDGSLQLKAMLSPDPLMGRRGYPLLLASGETANGRDRLIDRQHPHDLFMELSASVSQKIGRNSSVFVYGGLPGEPAFGPPAFMHRESIMDSPEAPITHHWLDSTHITFGVLTAGVIVDRFKIEASRFNGREPDQHRWNIETGPLDSTSVRLSWNPTRTLALQGSWAHLVDPEQLEPGVNQKRLSASGLWADDIAPGWHAAATLAWGRKSAEGHNDDGVALEGSLKHSDWTFFGRGEWIENRELIQGQDEPAYKVGKVSVGGLRDFRIAEHFSLGAGALLSLNFVPDGLAPLYGGRHPTGAMGFVRLKLD